MVILVKLQVVMMFKSAWNPNLVIGDLPSFLGRFIVICILVRRRELMVWGLSCDDEVYCEWGLSLLIFLSVECGWPSFVYCLCMVIECFAVFYSWFLVNDQRDAQILFYVFISIYNSLHVSSTSCSSSAETNCVNTASGNCHSMLVAEMCAGWTSSNLHTSRPPT